MGLNYRLTQRLWLLFDARYTTGMVSVDKDYGARNTTVDIGVGLAWGLGKLIQDSDLPQPMGRR